MPSYTPLQSIQLTQNTTSVTFSGIPQTYQDLILVMSVQGASAASSRDPGIRFNGDNTSNYSYTGTTGNGSTVSSFRSTNQTAGVAGFRFPTSNNELIVMHIQNYSNSTTFKSAILRTNDSSSLVGMAANLWRNTSPISSITILGSDLGTINMVTGSTFDLYGISVLPGVTTKAMGGEVTSDGTYFYHTFKTSDTFTTFQAITADVLVIAGGGASQGEYGSGGGGAGGLLGLTSQSLNSGTMYTVTVGAGGSGTREPTNGSNSQFGTLTAAVGGGVGGNSGGGSSTARNAGSGGSGGGGGSGSTYRVGGSGTAGQGNSGGLGREGSSDSWAGGGGGGAGAAGGNAGYQAGGSGGNGSSAYSSWGSATLTGQLSGGTYYYAGGGGGGVFYNATRGTAGLGGGGTGRNDGDTSPSNGTANTGGGAGGSTNGLACNGGSGLVIVRYTI